MQNEEMNRVSQNFKIKKEMINSNWGEYAQNIPLKPFQHVE